MRRAGRLLAWLPCTIAALGTLFVLWSAVLIIGETLGNPTKPYPATTTTAVVPGGEFGSYSTPSLSDFSLYPSTGAANVAVEITSLDVASQTVTARLSIDFMFVNIRQLRVFNASRSAALPLTAVRQSTWAGLPVGIHLTCPTTYITLQNCDPPIATVPLGDVVALGGRASSGISLPGTVTLPVRGWPNRFPSDVYELSISNPWISLPDSVILATNSSGSRYSDILPTTIAIAADPGLADHTLTVFEDSSSEPLTIGLRIGRSDLYQVTVYIVAFLPLLLGGVVVHIWLRRRQPIFDLGFIAALIAAMLAILPLRAVLVPTDFNTTGLTLVDDILVLGVLLIAVLLFFQYARIVAIRPMPAPHQSQTRIPSTRKRRSRRPINRP